MLAPEISGAFRATRVRNGCLEVEELSERKKGESIPPVLISSIVTCGRGSKSLTGWLPKYEEVDDIRVGYDVTTLISEWLK